MLSSFETSWEGVGENIIPHLTLICTLIDAEVEIDGDVLCLLDCRRQLFQVIRVEQITEDEKSRELDVLLTFCIERDERKGGSLIGADFHVVHLGWGW